MEEGRTSWQCERAPEEVPILISASTEEKIRVAQSERAEKQAQLGELEQEYKRAFSVLRDSLSNEHMDNKSKEAALSLCDEIKGDIKIVNGEIATLNRMLDELNQEHLVIPDHSYKQNPIPGYSRSTGSFNFLKKK